MSSMFRFASSFEKDVSSWDVSAVHDMYDMFYDATSLTVTATRRSSTPASARRRARGPRTIQLVGLAHVPAAALAAIISTGHLRQQARLVNHRSTAVCKSGLLAKKELVVVVVVVVE